MRKTIAMLVFMCVACSAWSQSDDVAFVVRKKKDGPTTIDWFDFDSLSTGEVYRIMLNNAQYKIDADSVLCLNMDCKRYLISANRVEYLTFGKDKPGKAYIALYSMNKKTKEWRQNSMRPVIFLDRKPINKPKFVLIK
jgi:hypothetical protein